MNSWNSEFVRSSFDKQARGFITNIEGKIKIQHPAVGSKIRRLVAEEGASADSADTVQRAQETFLANSKNGGFPFMQPLFGYVVEWLSVLGKTTELNALLDYAYTRFNRTGSEEGYSILGTIRFWMRTVIGVLLTPSREMPRLGMPG